MLNDKVDFDNGQVIAYCDVFLEKLILEIAIRPNVLEKLYLQR